MKDREFLIWLHERLEYIHGESPLVDYMRKLRGIIMSVQPDQESAPVAFGMAQITILSRDDDYYVPIDIPSKFKEQLKLGSEFQYLISGKGDNHE